jgi:hypothetical protein
VKRKYQNFSIIEKNAGEGKFQAEKIGRKRKPLRDAENVGLRGPVGGVGNNCPSLFFLQIFDT